MTTLQQALLVTVAFATFILLLFSVIAAVLTVMILKRIKIVVERARDSAENVAEIVEEVKDTVGNPANIAQFVTRIINKRKNNDK